jgi:hypothetical protein
VAPTSLALGYRSSRDGEHHRLEKVVLSDANGVAAFVVWGVVANT